MAWIEQTKKRSAKSGGPQYYLQEINQHNKMLLRQYGRRPVRLWTPYGVVDSRLEAVSSNVGSVGHDRMQSGRRVPNVADQIATWFGLSRDDIERIEFEDSFDHDSFVIKPSHVKFVGRTSRKTLYPDSHPLTLVSNHRSSLLTEHLKQMKLNRDWLTWVVGQIRGLIDDHSRGVRSIHEFDLLRSSGALDLLGIRLGLYLGGGIDCPEGVFKVGTFPEYPCPIEIEENSQGFLDKHHDQHRKQRIVVLCMTHNAATVLSGYVDVIELRELGRILEEVA